MLRPLDISAFTAVEAASTSVGKLPRLAWVAICDLVVDDTYQRGIGEAGRRNIYKIARAFDWSKFSPAVVAPTGKKFAIIDGQHRCTAAALRGISKVPCAIFNLTQAEQAAAFRAINAAVTALTRMQVHAAALVAGDADAVAIDRACKTAGVIICAYPKFAKEMVKGETVAVGALATNLRRYGHDVLVLALRLITETGKGNVGMVRAPIIGALCATLDAEPAWRKDERRLFRAMNSFDFASAFDAAAVETRRGAKGNMVEAMIERIGDHLDVHMGAKVA